MCSNQLPSGFQESVLPIEKNQVVAFHYVLKNAEGEEIVEGKNDIKTQLKFFNDLAINLNQYLNGDQDIDDEDW